MKQSGIDWIGEIPDGWEIRQIRNVILRGKNGIKIGPFGSTLTNKTEANYPYNIYGQANLVSNDFSFTKNTVSKQVFEELKNYEVVAGDICLSMMGTIGKCRTVPKGIKQGIMDSHLIKIRLDAKIITNSYFEYVYDKDYSGLCYQQMQHDKKGSIMDGLNTTIVKSLLIPLPSITEQESIAKMLDSKCAQIDTIIEESKKSIEEYKAWKQSVIFEAVTGKNLNGKKKDSGIEWIGEIPEKYIKTKLKYLLDIKGRIGFRGYTNADMVSEGEGAITLSPSNLKNLKMDFSKKAFVSWEKYNESPEIQIKIDDILFVKTGSSYGKSSLVNYLPIESTINPQLVVFKNIKCNKNFLIYYLQTNIIQNQVENIVIGGTIPTMSQEKMKNMFVFLPPLPEQESIAKMLDSKCAQIDSLIAEKESLIADLTEYKKSLIFEVVTGKRSV